MLNKVEKCNIIKSLEDTIKQYPNFYIFNITGMNVANTVTLRKEVKKLGNCILKVSKNTLITLSFKKSFESNAELREKNNELLKGISCVLFSNGPVAAPCKLIVNLRKELGDISLKYAYADNIIYCGEEGLKQICSLRSREELICDIVLTLYSVINNILSVIKVIGEKNSNKV